MLALLHEPSDWPQGFGVRQSSGALDGIATFKEAPAKSPRGSWSQCAGERPCGLPVNRSADLLIGAYQTGPCFVPIREIGAPPRLVHGAGPAFFFDSRFIAVRDDPSQLDFYIAEEAVLVQIGVMKKIALIVAGLAGFGTWEARPENKVDFAKDIQPILHKSCVECHGPEKPKGKLRLDSKEAALKGGQDGVVIVTGKADESDVYRRITLPANHDDVMPNKGDLLTKAQTDLIRDWINQGAEWPEGIVIASVPRKTEEPAAEATTTPKLPDYKPTAAELKAITMLESLGVAIRPIAANLGWREVNLRAQSADAMDKSLVLLRNVLGLVDLNLGGTKIKDADLANIKGLTNLNRLHLENTPITDAGLVHLKGLVNLNYLNLYGTPVTDAGLEQLKGLTHLKNLYLWQTKTTEAGVANLKKALPNVDISTGAEFKEIVKQEEKKDEKKEEKK